MHIVKAQMFDYMMQSLIQHTVLNTKADVITQDHLNCTEKFRSQTCITEL